MQRTSLWRTRAHVCLDCSSRLGLRPLSQNAVKRRREWDKEWQENAEHVRAGRKQSFLSLLEERGYVKDIAGDRNALDALFTDHRVGAYSGIDPTAPSLHMGHLLPMMVLIWMYIHGYPVTHLVGGATGKIGDPTGRLTSRQPMAKKTRTANLTLMHTRVRLLWKSAERCAARHGYLRHLSWRRSLANNATWLGKLNIIEFLSNVGTVARMGAMLGRDTVKNKMSAGDGMSYAEFTYPLLQAYDWWHMYANNSIQIQIGGSDQYGNIVAGIDLIKHLSTKPGVEQQVKDLSGPFGITVPLLTTSAGVKFGKSAGNAIWLDKDMTSPFELYGFLVRSADADVERYLKLFTFLPLDKIATVMAEHGADPSQRKAQHLLAYEVVDLVHGAEEAKRTQNQHTFSRRPDLDRLQAEPSETESAPLNRVYLPYSLVYLKQPGRILYHAGLAKSVGEGTRMVDSGGAYIGAKSGEDQASSDSELKFLPLKKMGVEKIAKLLDENPLLVLRTGKWNVKLVEVISDVEYDQRGLAAPGWEEAKQQRDGIIKDSSGMKKD